MQSRYLNADQSPLQSEELSGVTRTKAVGRHQDQDSVQGLTCGAMYVGVPYANSRSALPMVADGPSSHQGASATAGAWYPR